MLAFMPRISGHSRINPATLRGLRERAGLTLRDLEAESGVHFSFISQIESGDRKASPKTIRKLSVALGVDFDDLIGGDE
jgi:transcriptional regulator with XRE-family HTH domain